MANPDSQVSPAQLRVLKDVTTYHNPFDILMVLPEESNQDIRKKYRKVRPCFA